MNAANLSTNTIQSTVTVTPTTVKDEEEHEEVEQQPELHQAETAVTDSSSHREGVRHAAAAGREVSRGAEGGGIGELLGGSGGTVPSVMDEGLFSHRVMEEGECGPLDLSEYKVWEVTPL